MLLEIEFMILIQILDEVVFYFVVKNLVKRYESICSPSPN